MTLSGDIILREKGEAPLCLEDNRSTKKVKIQTEDPILPETNDRDKDLTGDEDMVNVDDLETSVDAEGDKETNLGIWGENEDFI